MSEASNGLPPTMCCKCGWLVTLNTSWTDQNPGRRFFGCLNYGNGEACKYFVWADGPICPRGKEVMPSLLARLWRRDSQNELKKHYAVLEGKIQTDVCCIIGIGMDDDGTDSRSTSRSHLSLNRGRVLGCGDCMDAWWFARM